MKYRTRIYYTDGQKALMWERWKEGWTLHQIAQLFNRAHTSVQGILSRTGGIRPPARSRCATAPRRVDWAWGHFWLSLDRRPARAPNGLWRAARQDFLGQGR